MTVPPEALYVDTGGAVLIAAPLLPPPAPVLALAQRPVLASRVAHAGGGWGRWSAELNACGGSGRWPVRLMRALA
jgi:hypothetical protein